MSKVWQQRSQSHDSGHRGRLAEDEEGRGDEVRLDGTAVGLAPVERLEMPVECTP